MRHLWTLLAGLILLTFSSIDTASAGVVPGTIGKGTNSASLQCNLSTSSYVTDVGCNAVPPCDLGGIVTPLGTFPDMGSLCDAGPAPGFFMDGGWVCTPPGFAGSGPFLNINSSANICDSWCGDEFWSASNSYNNYLSNSNSITYNNPGGTVHLTSDTQTCSYSTSGVASSQWSAKDSVSCTSGSCWGGGGGTSYSVNEGYCSNSTSRTISIASFDQVGNRNYQYNAKIDTVNNSAANTNLTASCNIEWRYATLDGSGPIITVGATSSVFDGDANNWCNLTKYQAGNYGSASNPVLAGCAYYQSKITHSAGTNPDLLENLDITVDDVSGISEIKVELGLCSGTYSLPTDAASIVTDTTDTTGTKGVKSSLRNITLHYNGTSTNGGAGGAGQGLPSLLTKFGKTRLDQCLSEGKNYLNVTAKDNARSNNDGSTYMPNSSSVDYSASNKFVKIDNTSPKLSLSGDAAKVAAFSGSVSCFVGSGVTVEPTDLKWKNYTIGGNATSTDPFGNNLPDCTTWTGILASVTNSCASPVPACDGIGCTAAVGVPTSVNQAWVNGAASCGFTCINGYTGANCTVPPAGNSCASPTPACNGFGCTAYVGTPVSVNQAWVKGAGSCGFICNIGWTGANCENPPTYSWSSGAFWACSATCNGGTQYRTVVCKRDADGAVVGDSYCNAGGIPKPAPSQACNTWACSCSLVWYDTTESQACGFGYQGDMSRTKSLQTNNTPTCVPPYGTVVYSDWDTSSCVNTYSWTTGTFGSCSASCWPGSEIRSVDCVRDSDGAYVADGFCDSGSRPAGSQACNNGVCIIPPTCSDGIQNQGETAVDCGGPNCGACGVAPTCSDGIQNQGETAVDCGGPNCGACTPPPTCTPDWRFGTLNDVCSDGTPTHADYTYDNNDCDPSPTGVLTYDPGHAAFCTNSPCWSYTCPSGSCTNDYLYQDLGCGPEYDINNIHYSYTGNNYRYYFKNSCTGVESGESFSNTCNLVNNCLAPNVECNGSCYWPGTVACGSQCMSDTNVCCNGTVEPGWYVCGGGTPTTCSNGATNYPACDNTCATNPALGYSYDGTPCECNSTNYLMVWMCGWNGSTCEICSGD